MKMEIRESASWQSILWPRLVFMPIIVPIATRLLAEAIKLQWVAEFTGNYYLEVNFQASLILFIPQIYGHFRNYIGPLAEKVSNLTGFAFESSASNQLVATQSSRIIKLEELLRPGSAYLN